MADEVDVEQTLVSIITSALYPSGTGQPCAAGMTCNVFRGWPTTQAQDDAKKQGFVNVSVYARNGVESPADRYPQVWQQTVAPAHTLTATLGGTQNNQITIGMAVGSTSISTPQNVVAEIGGSGSRQAFVYAVQASDTLTSIATGLASTIAASFPGTTSSGAVVTVNSAYPITVRIVSTGTATMEVGRTKKSFQITIWAPPTTQTGVDPDSWRTAVAKIVDPALRSLIRIVLPDQFYAHIFYERTITIDMAQNEGLYRRDLFYWVEFATTVSQTAYEIGVFSTDIQGGVSPDGTLDSIVGPTLTNNL